MEISLKLGRENFFWSPQIRRQVSAHEGHQCIIQQETAALNTAGYKCMDEGESRLVGM